MLGARRRRRPGPARGRARGRDAGGGSTRSTAGSSRGTSTAPGSARRRSRCRATCRSATTRCTPARTTAGCTGTLIVTPGLARPPGRRRADDRSGVSRPSSTASAPRGSLGRRRPHRPRHAGRRGRRASAPTTSWSTRCTPPSRCRRSSRRRTCPSSRRFFNPLYLRVEDIPEYAELPPARRAMLDQLRRAGAGRGSSATRPSSATPRWSAKLAALLMVHGVAAEPRARAGVRGVPGPRG